MNKQNLVKKLIALGAKVSQDIYSVDEFQAVLLADMVSVTINGKLYYELETDDGKFRFIAKKEFEVGEKITIQLWTQLRDYTKNGVLREAAKSEPFLALK